MGSSPQALVHTPVLASARAGVGVALRRSLPLWGMLLAAALIVSRRPDAVTHALFWAEDGKLFYANVYNHGLLASLTVPQAGYFEVLPTLASGLARFVPLMFAPLVTNVVAILVRALPVGLLLSGRAETIARDVRVRGLLAALYIALPGSYETDANIVNTMWFLAVAAVIVLMLRPPLRRSARVLDATILALCGLTGVFCIALGPLAFLYRRWRGVSAVSRTTLVILFASALIQLLAIFVLEYHLPSGFGAAPRASVPLQASVGGFFQILGLRVIAQPLLGNSLPVGMVVAIVLGVLGSIGALAAFRRATAELRLMIAFGCAVFVMVLARPLGSGWPGLLAETAGGRYFVIPQFAAIATLVWAVGRRPNNVLLIPLLGLVLFMCLVAIPREWRYEPFAESSFQEQAQRFERAPAGTRMGFPLAPPGWKMTLVKH